MTKTCLAVLILCATVIEASEYSCSTPSDWFYGNHEKILWPAGNVLYYLNSSLTQKDTEVIYEAFKEYHSKTCIRFVPKQDTDTIFTSIENNNDVCGSATVCMREGYQYARFGGNCKTKQTMIHELGHNLCLTHEDQRSDRDEFLKTCTNSSLGDDSTTPNRYFYDYASQMHGACSDDCLTPKIGYLKTCGPQVTDGLSLLDVDYINELYGCGGCFRHRWVPVEKFTEDMEKDLPDYGKKFDHHTPYPCRSYLYDVKELSVGTFWLDTKICYVSQGGVEVKLEGKGFEILTVPGGLHDFQSEYSLMEVTDSMTQDEINAVVADAVPAISNPWAETLSHHIGYVTYGNLGKYHCNWGEGEVDLTGKAIHYDNNFALHFPLCSKEVRISKADILVCRPKLPKLYPDDAFINDPFKHWKLRHMEPIDSSFADARISILGKRFPHSTDIYFVFSEQISSGPIFLHLHFHFNSKTVLKINYLTKDSGWNNETRLELGNEVWLSTENNFKIEIMKEGNEFHVIVNSFVVASHTYIGDVVGGSTHFLRCYRDTKIDSVYRSGQDLAYIDTQEVTSYTKMSSSIPSTDNELRGLTEKLPSWGTDTQEYTSLNKISSSTQSTDLKGNIGDKDNLQSCGTNTFLKTGMYVLLSVVVVALLIVGVFVFFKHRRTIQEKYLKIPLIFEKL